MRIESRVAALAVLAGLLVRPPGAAGAGFEEQAGDMMGLVRQGFIRRVSHQSQDAVHRRLSAEIAHLVEESMPGVAKISAGDSSGTGFVIRADGLLLTNAHVVEEVGAGAEVMVAFSHPPRKLAGKVLAIGSGEGKDVAVVKLNSKRKDWFVLSLGETRSLKPGQWVVALGHPRGERLSVSKGVLSGKDRNQHSPHQSYLQTDAAINPGNSGGPLLSMDGKVIGMNTFILSASGGSEGMGYAVTAEDLRRVLAYFHRTAAIVSGHAGLSVHLRDGLPAVENVLPGGPAERAGVQAGDILRMVDGRKLSQDAEEALNEVLRAIKTRFPGDTVVVTVERGGRLTAIPLRLEAEPPKPKEEKAEGGEPSEGEQRPKEPEAPEGWRQAPKRGPEIILQRT